MTNLCRTLSSSPSYLLSCTLLTVLLTCTAIPAGATETAPETKPTPFLEISLAAYDQAIARYEQIAADGGWGEAIPADILSLRPGMRSPLIAHLRARLHMEGDLHASEEHIDTIDTDLYDQTILDAVARFQQRHGLRPYGLVDSYTLGLINKPATHYAARLKLNRARLSALQATLTAKKVIPGRYIFINTGSASLEAVSEDRSLLTLRVAIGGVNTQTPLLISTIDAVSFFPKWTAPASVAQRVLLARLHSDPNYAADHGIRIYRRDDGSEIDATTIDWQEQDIRHFVLRQNAGQTNPLGLIKISFPNKYAVFLHDTPAKSIFNHSVREVSAGCVRVEDAKSLAAWLLANHSRWNIEEIAQTLKQTEDLKTLHTRIRPIIPIIIGYFTAWTDPDGTASFRSDIYGYDRRPIEESFPESQIKDNNA